MWKVTTLLLIGLVLPQTGSTAAKQEPPPKTTEKASTEIDSELTEKLLRVKRIYVESFGEDKASVVLQGMVINALHSSKRFIVTENKDKADAILKGGALEKTSQEFHALGEGAAVAQAAGAHSSSVSGSTVGGTGTISGSGSGGFVASSIAAEDSVASTETINDARVAVRLVSTDGDVLWSSTQESKGAKYKGAMADVADKVVKQLLKDLEKLQKTQGASKQPS